MKPMAVVMDFIFHLMILALVLWITYRIVFGLPIESTLEEYVRLGVQVYGAMYGITLGVRLFQYLKEKQS